MLDSNWLQTIHRFWAEAECVRQCIKIGSWFIFGSVRLFGENCFELFSKAPARIIIKAWTNFDACS